MNCNEIEPVQLHDFLKRVYPPSKADFLIEHGAWWHGSNANRMIIQVNGQIAGYCGVIPTQARVAGKIVPALWWVDLMIAPEFRGRKLQLLFDQRVREIADLLLGFPNELAAGIHRKHSWGVREDLSVMLLPLQPTRLNSVQSSHKLAHKIFLLGGALALSPLAAFWRARLGRQAASRAWKMEKFDAGLLASIAKHTPFGEISTNLRDAPYLDWRYGRAPKPDEYSYYLAGSPKTPTHYLIARHVRRENGFLCTRILDLVGDFRTEACVHDLLVQAVQDAIRRGSIQLTLAAGPKELRRTARKLGFLFTAPLRFCWWSSSSELMARLANEAYWTLGDSDNDPSD